MSEKQNPMNITCYVRRTRLWAEQYKHSEEWINYWRADYIAKIWNDTFNIKYSDFRRRLNQLQEENFKEVSFNSIVNQYEYKSNYARFVPTDDDDWFSPKLIEALRDCKEQNIYWNFINYTEGAVTIQNPSICKMKFIYESNNYATIQPKNELVLKDHIFANNNISNGKHLDDCLSVHNRTLASLGLLREKLIGKTNPQKELLEQYYVARQKPIIDNGVPAYFLKFLDKMLHIYQNELCVKKMFV